MLRGLKSTHRQRLLSIPRLQRTLYVPSEQLLSQTRLARVDFQLDYHLSSQFAGLVYAQHKGIYAKHGLDVALLAPPAAGEEPALVSRMQEELGQQSLVLGSVEQNTLVAAQIYGQLPIRAVSAMLHSTPLAIAAPPGSPIKTLKDLAGKRVAAASDTEEIVRSALAAADPALVHAVEILPVRREDKLKLFEDGQVDAFQVYTTTEALQLKHTFGELPTLMPFGERHGFAQVVFAHQQSLANSTQRAVARAFLDATYEGWAKALQHKEHAAQLVVAARDQAGVNNSTAAEGEYSDSLAFQLESLECLEPYLVPYPGYQMGRIDIDRFMSAADQITNDLKSQQWFQHGSAPTEVPQLLLPSKLFEHTLWPQPNIIRTVNAAGGSMLALDGQHVAESRKDVVRARAARFEAIYHRRPKLAVIQVESNAQSSLQHPERQQASPNLCSWLDKTAAGEQMGVCVEQHQMCADSSTEEIMERIRQLNRQDDIDGILMELPDKMGWSPELDSYELLATVHPSKCVDGMTPDSIAAMVSNAASATRTDIYSYPTTPASVLDLLEQGGVSIEGRHAVVVGNSRLCGQPTSLMLQKEGATVSIATSRTPAPTLDALCAMADIVISVVGKSGLIRKEMVRPGATLVNVGTTFDGERLIPDIDLGSIDGSGHLVTPVPGGIGPSPVTVLMENLVTRAEARAQSRGESSEQTLLGKAEVANFIGNSDWQCLEEKSLRKSFVADNFETATMMVNDIGAIANDMNHHPQVSIQPVIGDPAPACFNNGCSVEFTLHSLDVAGISDRDLSLAKRIDQELMGA